MSFSGEIKEDLSKQIPKKKHCRLAELSAIQSFLGKNGASSVTERVIKRLQEAEPEEHILSREELERLLEADCCRRSYLRGAFLAAGSMSDPEKGYHLEIVCHGTEEAERCLSLLAAYGLKGRRVARKTMTVVYLKEGDEIVDVLNLMGAHHALLEFENIRVLKDMRNKVNRRVNCEAANLGKTASAALRQIEAIEKIDQTVGLSSLPASLREIAEVRRDNPDFSLQELGEALRPPVGKSGVNHRLRRLMEIAETV